MDNFITLDAKNSEINNPKIELMLAIVLNISTYLLMYKFILENNKNFLCAIDDLRQHLCRLFPKYVCLDSAHDNI